ncbi:hypothetical protein GCM10027432_26950 [Lysobacter fragariae]
MGGVRTHARQRRQHKDQSHHNSWTQGTAPERAQAGTGGLNLSPRGARDASAPMLPDAGAVKGIVLVRNTRP